MVSLVKCSFCERVARAASLPGQIERTFCPGHWDELGKFISGARAEGSKLLFLEAPVGVWAVAHTDAEPPSGAKGKCTEGKCTEGAPCRA